MTLGMYITIGIILYILIGIFVISRLWEWLELDKTKFDEEILAAIVFSVIFWPIVLTIRIARIGKGKKQ